MSSDLFKPKGDLEEHIKNLTDNWEVNQKIRARRKCLHTKDLNFVFLVNIPYKVFRKAALEKHLDNSLDFVQLAINSYPRMNYRIGYHKKKLTIKRHKQYDDLARFHDIIQQFKESYKPQFTQGPMNIAKKIDLYLERELTMEDVLNDIDYTLPQIFEQPKITISKIYLKKVEADDFARSNIPFSLIAEGYRKLNYL